MSKTIDSFKAEYREFVISQFEAKYDSRSIEMHDCGFMGYVDAHASSRKGYLQVDEVGHYRATEYQKRYSDALGEK